MGKYDEIGFDGLQIKQDDNGFKYGVDAVLLSDFAANFIRKSGADTVIDLGTGNGIIPLIISRKTDVRSILGVEKQHHQYKLAMENAERNDLTDRIGFINEDIVEFKCSEKVDCVVSNPPYVPRNSGITNKRESLATARHETTATIEDFIRVASNLLTTKGNFFLIHRPSRLVDLFFYARKYKLEPKAIKYVLPNPGDDPTMVLLQCVKDGNAELTNLRPISVYDAQGKYSEEINSIYRV